MLDLLESEIRRVLLSLQIEPPAVIEFSRPKDPKFGDLSTNVAMSLARDVKQNPRQLAQHIIDGLDLQSVQLSKADVAGGGFINFYFAPAYVGEVIQRILREPDRYGRHRSGEGKRVNVEFVSANPTGPLSIGHGRQAVLGDVLCRLLANAGWSVIREYYFNNAGKQMKRLGDSVRLRYLQILGETVEFPDNHYEGEYIRDIAAQIADRHGDSWKTKDFQPFKEFAEEILFSAIRAVLKKIGLSFDVYFNEDSLYQEGKLDQLLSLLKEKRLTYTKDDALWLKTSDLNYTHGSRPDGDRVLVKSTGEPTYRLPDMAYHVTKFDRGFDRIIDIFGADHVAEYPDVLAALQALGYDIGRVSVLVHQFVTLSHEGEVLKMSKRKANFVTIDELVDALGSDVFRYFLVMRSHHSHFQFDLELARQQTMENPVYYVQNAHARICSIESKAVEKGHEWPSATPADLSLLTATEERDIVLKLDEYPELTRRLVQNLEVHPLTTYLEELAGLYHRYQTAGKKNDALRVVTDDAGLTLARLSLCRATRIVLARGLSLLGVSAPTYMAKKEDSDDQ
jgi:arginyl-tRNA synthetase